MSTDLKLFGFVAMQLPPSQNFRVAPSNLTAILRELTELRICVARLEYEVVQLIREQGVSWELIAEELDISRQAAARRFAKPKGRRL